jgi:hypothetical protein
VSVVANVAINVDASKALGQLKAVDQASKGLDSGFKAAAVGAKGLGGAIAASLGPLLAVTTAVAGLKAGFDLLATKQADVANLERGLEGLVANSQEAAKALVGIADELGKQTLFNEEDFTQGFKLLTSFKSIAVDSYERVATAAADVAAVTNQDLNGSLLQLSKALEDPEKGLTALARSGTTFTEQQKDQVKALVASGKKLEAQDFILKELERQYGGAAKAAGSAGFAGVMDTLGEVVRDLQRALAAILESPIKGFFDVLGKAVGRVAEGWEYFGNVLKTQLLPILQPLIDKIGEITGGFDITKFIDLWQGGLVIAIRLVAGALELVVPAVVKVLDTLAAIGNNPVFQTLIAPLKAVIENLLSARGEITEFQEQSKGSRDALKGINDEAKGLPTEIERAKTAQDAKTKAVQDELTALKSSTIQIDAQIASLDRGASINSARYEAEKAFNDLQGQQLERQYGLAKTAQQRLGIAVAIFHQQAQAAQIEYRQAIENIKLEQRKQELQIQSAQLKYKEIEAEGQLQILKAGNAKEEAKKRAQLQEALAAQNQVVQATYDNASAQQQIAQYEEQTAAAQLESKMLAAQTALEQKLVSDKIGLSQTEAVRLSTGLMNSQTSSGQLATSTNQVAQNALGAAGNFIRVATEADRAAASISNAANQQARLNALQGGGGSSPAPVQQAAEGAYWPGGFKAFADGGVVTQPTMGIVGEGGEPEYIIPASKMQEAMERYASGQRGSSVIPTSVNPQVSVTTGPVMNMDGQNYVSQQDFMTGLQTASKRGAEMALQTLSSSYSARRSAGIT